jgi:hypothetical protein
VGFAGANLQEGIVSGDVLSFLSLSFFGFGAIQIAALLYSGTSGRL